MNLISNGHQHASKQEKQQSYPVPAEGSLGLLALGWRGLLLWRAARAASIQSQNKQSNEQKG
ncbi:MAG: hypothetical protein IM638_10170 [Bacteroidetes bacterium]|nr:hypothetical protein [Bacteroidota bacterium]